jgi:hypothetical protein
MFSFGGGTASGSQREPQETERGSHGNAVAVFLIPGDSLIEIVRSALVVALCRRIVHALARNCNRSPVRGTSLVYAFRSARHKIEHRFAGY